MAIEFYNVKKKKKVQIDDADCTKVTALSQLKTDWRQKPKKEETVVFDFHVNLIKTQIAHTVIRTGPCWVVLYESCERVQSPWYLF